MFAVSVKEISVARLRVVRILARARDFALLQNVQTGCEAQ
jgi:hypothetical protein